MKKIALLLMVVGFSVIGYGLWSIIGSNLKEKDSLQTAKAIVNEETSKEGLFQPEIGEVVGVLAIPKLEAELPIIEGADPDELEKGVGHYRGSFYPDENGQIVLSGHRDTVFRGVGELAIGDILEVQVPYGTYQYKITHTKIVDKDDTSIITLQDSEEELVVTTCYPFSFIGDAPERYIMYGERVE
ncbi:sortase A [Cytobacillus horneckiae]|uniref:class D sortase n=1 Tax=Cytobacillus horneckiae TaxID=549687 RepID=UPI001561B940|nr:class D sortase [Cytobacillus horneckiae]MBN6886175.1 class D sortase [Cytobacillus horneckiae]NRG44984.1 class D sortase [Bacillus sp. CRN 9]